MKLAWILLLLLISLVMGGCVDEAERFLRPVPMADSEFLL